MRTGEIQGIWWLPTSEGTTVPGTLRLSHEERPALTLFGSIEPQFDLTDHLKRVFGRTHELPLVFGIAADGTQLTLTGGRLATKHLNLETPQSATFELVADAAYVGGKIDPSNDTFIRAEFVLEGLVDWVGYRNFEFDWGRSSDEPRRLTIQGVIPETLRASTEQVEIAVSTSISTGGDGSRVARMTTNAVIRLESADGLNVNSWLTAFVGPLRQLACLALGRPVAVERFAFGAAGGADIEMIWKHPLFGKVPDRPLLRDEMMFSLGELRDSLSDKLQNWLRASTDLEPVFDLFFGIADAGSVYEEDRFGNLTEALEAYHRRRIGSRPEETNYTARVARVLGSVAASDRPWLAQALENSGEYRLAERLLGLLHLHPWLIGQVVPSGAKRWVGKVVAERNFRSHHDPSKKSQFKSGSGLLGFSMRLTVLLEACLLSELGFDEAAGEEMIKRASPAFRILRLNPGL